MNVQILFILTIRHIKSRELLVGTEKTQIELVYESDY